MLGTLQDSGDPEYWTRVVIADGSELDGEIGHTTGINYYYTTVSDQTVYAFVTDEGRHLCGGRSTFIISPYQDEPLEVVPRVA